MIFATLTSEYKILTYPQLTMNLTDIIFILILIANVAYSIYRGMIKELVSLASIAIGYITAIHYYLHISSYTSKVLNPSISGWVSFIGIFILVWIIVILIGKLLQMILKVSVTLSLVDRVAGGIIGLAKGIIILSIITLFLSSISFTRGYILKSITVKYIVNISRTFMGISPLEFVKELRSGIKNYKFIPAGEYVSEKDRKELDEIINKGIK